MSAPSTTMTAVITAMLATLDAHAWPSPIAQIGLRGPTDLTQSDPTVLLLATPALYLNCAVRRGDDPSVEPRMRQALGGRVMRRCQWQVYCLLGQSTRAINTEIFEMSEAVTALIERREYAQSPRLGHRWGLGAAVGYPVAIEDGDADLGVNGVLARVVQWEQVVYLPELEPLSV